MWSIIHRELLEQARRPYGMLLRLAGGGVLIAALGVGWRLAAVQRQNDGRGLFTLLNHLVIAMIWLLAPVLTADCISRERREGTLGLLFLTPLSSLDVVIGKVFAHAFRAFTVVWVAIPVLTVPIVLGGLTGWDVLRMLLLHLSVLGLSLAAGLLASSVAESWVRARLLAFGLAVASGVGFAAIYTAFAAMANWRLLQRMVPNATFAGAWMGQLWGWRQRLLLHGGSGSWSRASFWEPIAGNPGNAQSVGVALRVLGLSLILVALGIAVAAFSVRRSWQPLRLPQRRRGPAVVDRSSNLVALKARWLQRARALDRSPVRWLLTRTGTQRGFALGWLALVVAWVSGWMGQGADRENVLLVLLAGSGLVGSFSFHTEREQGGLELLLVTPLSPQALIQGRMAVLIRQFAPASAAAIACFVWRDFDFALRHGALGWGMSFGPFILWAWTLWASMTLGIFVSVGAGGRGVRQALAAMLPPGFFVGLLGLFEFALGKGAWGLAMFFVLVFALMGVGGWILLRLAERRLRDRVFLRG